MIACKQTFPPPSVDRLYICVAGVAMLIRVLLRIDMWEVGGGGKNCQWFVHMRAPLSLGGTVYAR